MSSGGAGAGAAMLASAAATTMATAAFGAMMVVGMRGCAAEPSGASHPVHPAAAAAAAEPEDDGSAALRALSALQAELKAATLAGLCQRAEAAGVTGAEVERALRNDPLAAREQLISLLLAHGDGGAAAPEASDLEMELQELKLTALHKRALSAGVAESSVEAAMDSSDPKGGLIGLIVDVESRRGPADRVRSCLEGGGEACAEMISDALDHAMEVLEGLSVSSPRKARKGLLEMMEHVESRLETVVDVEWCDGVCRCGEEEMVQLSSLLVSVRGLSLSSSGVSETSDAVTALLECLDRCGSVVVQSMAVLSGGSAASVSSSSVLSALESLRCLSDERLDAVNADEAAAYEAVLHHLSGLDVCAGNEVVSSCMALHTLGCRNGASVCGRVDVLETGGDVLCRWLEYASSGGDDYEAGAAIGALQILSILECGPKIPVESRQPFEKVAMAAAKSAFGTVSKAFTEQGARTLFVNSMKADVLRHEDISLACGWGLIALDTGYMHRGALSTANESGMFSTALELYRRVEPSSLPDAWWLKTCDVVDVTSSQLQSVWATFSLAKHLSSATQSSWWPELLNHAIRLCKLNASVGLSERDTMCIFPFQHGLASVELAAQDESQHEMLIASGVADALEYGILHDFTYIGNSVGVYASGTAVALVGRNEGGKVLRREAVHAVLARLHQCFQRDSAFFSTPPKSVTAHLARVTVMVISDANKKHMLQFEPLIDMLLECLIIDDGNRRKDQDGADMLQEASAGVLHELSLYGPGAAALRLHGAAVSTLHTLCEVGTKVSKERGAAALFEVEEDKRPNEITGYTEADDGSGPGLSSEQKQKQPPPHVMASYNWDHQDVILRVVVSLQDRGYLVWVDTEQMKGATVDTMALAVEGSAVVLIGVSRAYKESSNCRMEAQYALQKKKPLVPLMMTEGYEADGWLGLLLGTSM
eukprot:COSAG06_NODE_4420_length_4284_cov_41.313978_1_plen_937_part_10